MAENEGVRKTPKAVVVSMCPDVCHTPRGGKMVPVPYDILAHFGNAKNTVPTVRMRGLETFTRVSYIQGVQGNEPGKGGGVKTGVHARGGICSPVHGTETQYVKANKNLILYHSSHMWMNGAAPGPSGNTLGHVMYLSSAPKPMASHASTNPKAKPENEKELKKKKEKEIEVNSERETKGYAERHARGTDVKPGERSQAPIKTGVESQVKWEQKTFDESVWSTDDGNLKVGNLYGQRSLGVGYDHVDGAYKAGGSIGGGFSTINTTTGTLSGANGLLEGSVSAEALAIKGDAGIEATLGNGKAAIEGKAGVEVIVVQAIAKGALKITPKRAWDYFVGRPIKQAKDYLPAGAQKYAEAPDWMDKGIEVTGSATGGLGGAAKVSAKAGFDKNAKPGESKFGFSTEGKLGLGPMLGLKFGLGVVY